ncbi:acyltransferase family protein [Lactobacillus mulieris]|uniref:acyltransferase family protein n=1 Tax=Lactobacillus mulieris TaxID=2508708 RepID=UPI001433173E|nr:acyltransferase family protein [Lactobacillus mulieris]MCW8104469.1 acyltransferase [Lactobacillus mulieris]MDK6802974.1 acyltransferase family protein [Lactobacillus mulieris]MDK8382090.1 acyltransferase family protein [Lactobacillus mulieris]MDT9620306.1 acyltransferase family protein [Lactobacillus mulieris]NKC41194.1 acyltransferase [Lactobacillus mulieris]
MFFFISGFLFGQRKIKDDYTFIKKRVGRIVLDYYVCLIIDLVFYALFAKEYLTWSGIKGLLFFYGTIRGLGHLWFIPVIVCLYIATPIYIRLIDDIENKLSKLDFHNLIIFRVIEMGILYIFFIWVQNHFGFLGLFYSFNYSLGLMTGRYKAQNPNSYNWLKFWLKFAGILAIIGTFICIYHEKIGRISLISAHIGFYYNTFYPLNHMLLGIALFNLFYLIELKFKVFERFNKIARISDKYSYDIYLSHHIWIQNPLAIFNLPFLFIFKFIMMIIAVGMQTFVTRYISNRLLLIFKRIK